MADHNQLGHWGEALAAIYLRERGYCILHSDWRNAHRDIDIVAAHWETLVFVEVKTLKSNRLAEPEDAVDYEKRANISRSIRAYLGRYRISQPYRFDIIAITGSPGHIQQIKHFEDVQL